MGGECVMKCIPMDLFLFVSFSEALVRRTYRWSFCILGRDLGGYGRMLALSLATWLIGTNSVIIGAQSPCPLLLFLLSIEQWAGK